MDYFDARTVQPQQGFGGHPPGMHDFQITNTFGKATKNNDGGMFVVEFTSPVGKIESRYNLWNKSNEAVEIARKELSALCHAVGIFQLSFPKNQDGSPNLAMAGFELRGGRGRMEVAKQKDSDYMEIVRVFDSRGNEPGKGAAAAPQPMQPQPQGGWGNPPAQQQPQPQPQPPQGWGNQPQPQPAPAPQPPQQQQPGGWQQQPQQQQPGQQPPGGGAPPWARG